MHGIVNLQRFGSHSTILRNSPSNISHAAPENVFFFAHSVFIEIGHLKTNEHFFWVTFLYLWFTSFPSGNSHLMCISPVFDVTLKCLSSCVQIHIYKYIFMCLTLEREREGNLSFCTSSVLFFCKLIYICHASWRQNITAALNTRTFHTFLTL